jgi:hypothetical protein
MPYVLGFVSIIIILLTSGAQKPSTERVSVAEANNASIVDEVVVVDASESVESSPNTNSRSNPSNVRETIVAEEPAPVYRPPVVTSYSARNIEYNSAVVRADVDMRSYENGVVFAVYGYDRNQVADLAQSYTVTQRNFNTRDDRARVVRIDQNARGQESYERRISRLVSDADYYYQVCLAYTNVSEVEDRVCSAVESFTTSPDIRMRSRFTVPRIRADRALDITASEATMLVSLDMNDGVDGIPFLVYGSSRQLVEQVDDRYERYSQVREYEEDLQKDRLGVRRLGQSVYTVQLDDLRGDSTYYYRPCVEYDGTKDGLVCGWTSSFETDSQNNNIKPTLTTREARVTAQTIELRGHVRMNDFIDGYAFFVYGTDRERVLNVPETQSFNRIRQSIDTLQKQVVDSDVDGRNSYQLQITDLQRDTTYHYRMCIQYVDENRYGNETFFVRCGEVQSATSL